MRTHVPAQSSLSSEYEFLSKQASDIVLNSIDQSFILIDFDLKIVDANEFAKTTSRDMLGVTITPGISILDLARPEHHEMLKQTYKAIFQAHPELGPFFFGMNDGEIRGQEFFFAIAILLDSRFIHFQKSAGADLVDPAGKGI